MKRWRAALIGLMAVALIGFGLLWFLPASWALPVLATRLPGVRLQQVSGLLWDGRAGQVLSAKGEDLGQVDWQLSRRALLGDTRLQLNLHGTRLDFSGRMEGQGVGEATWMDVHLRADMGLFGPIIALPMGQPRGVVRLAASRVQLHGGWPQELDGKLRWDEASLLTPRNGNLSLGNLLISVQGSGGVLAGRVQDDGSGPLRIDGEYQLSPLARRFSATAAARGPNPALQRWLNGLGPTDAGGKTHINYSGGLAAAIPEGAR
ncbi:type II secretion system protein N [Dyella halodurans]|uniref:Type II secretion system protein N n=1 Tax=Dyella halodurans TaxID=1920171 RepID=A0ABV9C6M2_9GAMM|nr:type II secretion system protein N [Dyella halodurans]